MTTSVQKPTNSFSEKAKKALAPGEEISQNGLIYRKRKDGFGTWRYDFTKSGERFKDVIGSDSDGVTLSQARQVLAEIKAKSITDSLNGKTGRSTQAMRSFQEVSDEFMHWGETHYRAHHNNVNRMKQHLLPRFSTTKLVDITTSRIEKMRSELVRVDYSPRTIERIVSLLSAVFEFAKKSDPNLDNPTRRLSRIKHQDPEVLPFSKSETQAMLDYGVKQYMTITRGPRKGAKTLLEDKTAEFRVIVGLALYAGLRASEALGLTWDNVSLTRGKIRVQQVAEQGQIRESTKNYKARTIPITPSLRPLLEDLYRIHLAKNREKGLLLSGDGNKPYNQIQAMFGRIKSRAGVQAEGGYHTLRHTFATRAIENGIDLPTLQKFLGHSDVKTTMRYVHVTDEHLTASASKLD